MKSVVLLAALCFLPLTIYADPSVDTPTASAPKADKQATPSRTPEQTMNDEIVRRKAKELKADRLIEEGMKAYRKKDYETATRKWIAAQVLLRES